MSTAGGCSTWCSATLTRSGCTGCRRASTPRLSAVHTDLISGAGCLRIDHVGRLPERPGDPVPQPELRELLHQLGEQLAHRRQIEHARLAVLVHHPPGLGSTGRAAGLVAEVAGDGPGNARPIGTAG